VVGGLVVDSQFLQTWRGVETHNSRSVTVRDTSTVDIGHAGVAFKDTTDSVVRNTTHNVNGGDYGIELVNSSRNLVINNQVRHWISDGIVVIGAQIISASPTADNIIIGNDVRNGSSTGIELVEVGGGTVRDNVVSGNTIIGTSDTGILVDALTPADPTDPSASCPCQLLIGVGPSNNRIKDNISNNNLLDGIHLYAPGNIIAGNVANRNGDWGIDAIAGNTDGGGNRARGNGQAAQCRGVRCAA
jgi:parallel beta-helix repeat protein